VQFRGHSGHLQFSALPLDTPAGLAIIACMEKKIQSTLARGEGCSYKPASALLKRMREERDDSKPARGGGAKRC
jgi:hypothetical protein